MLDRVLEKDELKDLSEVENYLEELQKGASESFAAALDAQLQVIRYVSSPELVDSSLDLLFANVKKALKYSSSKEERERILEQSHLMIHNYVFFLNAKLEYATSKNKEQGELLLKQAADELVNSVGKSILISGGNPKLAMGRIVIDIISKAHKSGFFQKVVNWIFAGRKNAKEWDKFMRILKTMFKKLEKYKSLIGKSDLIAGIIERYDEDLAKYNCSELKVNIEDIKNKNFYRGLIYLVLLGLIFVGLFIADLFQPSFGYYLVSYGKWVLLFFGSVEFCFRMRTQMRIWKYKNALKKEEEKYKNLANHFTE